MFELSVALTDLTITAAKSYLRGNFPHVKSSHRAEALARGFGFLTYASMLTEASEKLGDTISLNAKGFGEYLLNHNFDVAPEEIFHAAAYAAIRLALEKLPRLTTHGMGIGPIEKHPDGTQATAKQHNERFRSAQTAFVSEDATGQFLRSLALLRLVKPIKSINNSYSSYGLKHIAENLHCTYPTGKRLGPDYVSNGAFIAAAAHAGFAMRQFKDSLNVTFNMSNTCLKDLECEIRKDGVRAQERQRQEELRRRSKEYGIPASRLQY